MSTEPITPLLAWLRKATPEQRERAATLAGTTTNYMYQLATPGGKRGQKISANMAFRLEDSMRKVEAESQGALPAVTARELADMWTVAGF